MPLVVVDATVDQVLVLETPRGVINAKVIARVEIQGRHKTPILNNVNRTPDLQ